MGLLILKIISRGKRKNMENSLIIGNTSQLSFFLPIEYDRISSRNIDFNYLKNNEWDSVYMCFAEQNMIDKDVDFISTNFTLTKNIIDSLTNIKRIVIYTSSELWNQSIGKININDKFNYQYSNDYCLSKELLFNYIKTERSKGRLNNVIIIHPFNFNSTYRNSNYLFGKVFNSIIFKKKILLNDTYFHRDIVHAKYMAKRSLLSNSDEIIGSGRLFHINEYIRDLYKHYNMEYDEYVTEDLKTKQKEKNYYSEQYKIYSYEQLLKDTIEDIDNAIEKNLNYKNK